LCESVVAGLHERKYEYAPVHFKQDSWQCCISMRMSMYEYA
jgi:hypothetical protein